MPMVVILGARERALRRLFSKSSSCQHISRP
jgi:hypothetical protein